MGIMDVLKIRKAVTKQQKGDIQGALEDYEALYGAGVVNVTYMLPYAVILLKKGGEENYLKVKEILRKAEKAPNMTPEYRQQLLMDYAVANYKLGEMDKALQLLEALLEFPGGDDSHWSVLLKKIAAILSQQARKDNKT